MRHIKKITRRKHKRLPRTIATIIPTKILEEIYLFKILDMPEPDPPDPDSSFPGVPGVGVEDFKTHFFAESTS